MGEEEAATIEGQFYAFSRLFNNKRSGTTINLSRNDYWMRQANILDDRKVTMTDTGIHFYKFEKVELNWDEWLEFLSDLCRDKNLEEQMILDNLTNCGVPGQTTVEVPQYRNFFKTYNPKQKAIIYCSPVFDGFLCWPPTIAGELSFQKCPFGRHSDPSSLAFRQCDSDGSWLDKDGSSKGFTNFTQCFSPEMRKLLEQINNDEYSKEKLAIVQNTRHMQIVGFSVSMIALLISLFILTYFRSLHNNRTNIHRNLFAAMTIQVFIRLVMYTDQAIVMGQGDLIVPGIDSVPFICEASYTLLEYGITSTFMWMFIEGLYLHGRVTYNILQENESFKVYAFIGWGVPALITSGWAIVNALHYKDNNNAGCWFGYNYIAEYWCLQGPRVTVILINFCFLLHIMRVVIAKLNEIENNDFTVIKKAVKAALVLLPLLGVTNFLNMIEPAAGAVWQFTIWCYATHFCSCFQGLFLSLIYCFTNYEVIEIIRRNYRERLQARRLEAERERNYATQQQPRSGWWRTCHDRMMTPLGKARRWLLGRMPNMVEDAEVDISMHSIYREESSYADPNVQSCMEEVRDEGYSRDEPNYDDPYVLSCMEEVRVEGNRLVAVGEERNYADPNVLNCMEEVRVEGNRLVVVQND